MSDRRFAQLTPLTITLIYVVVGGAWIAFSDRLLAALLSPGPLFATLTTGKGWVFVAGSGLLIYCLTASRERQLRETVTDLTKSRKQLSILHRVLRHNLRNCCTIVQTSSDLLATGTEDEVALTHLQHATEKLVEISEKSRHLKSLFEGQESVEIVDLPSRIDSVVGDLEPSLSDATIQTCTPDEAAAAVDSHLDIALTELVTNAVEHHDAEEPKIWIAVDDDPTDGVRLDVADDGPGIPEMERDVLGAGIEKPMFHSQGLGLWIVRAFVEQSGGDVRVIDNEPRGSIVRMHFPSEPTRQEAAADTR